jgi:MSHA pilin protein MshB
MKKQQSGFTIIELVVVIILLGIMAATALPRFMDVTTEAHEAVVNSVQGALSSSGAMFHATWIAEGQPVAGTAMADYGSLLANADGYPCGTACTANVVSSQADCAAIFSNLLQANAPTVTAAGTTAASVIGTTTDFAAVYTTPTACDFYYTDETSVDNAQVLVLTFETTTGAVTRATSAAL